MRAILKILPLLLIVYIPLAYSENVNKGYAELFSEANKLYSSGHYGEALERYLNLKESGVRNKNLYYNIGNTYFRLGRIGLAILFYEKALIIHPRDPELIANLRYAKKSTIDKIDETANWRVLKLIFLHSVLSLRELLFVFSVSYITLWMFLVAGIRYKNRWLRRACIAGVFAVVFFGISFVSMYASKTVNKRVVVIEQETDVTSGYDSNAVTLFRLHEGSEATILSQTNEWAKIEIDDGKKGWIRSSALIPLSDNL